MDHAVAFLVRKWEEACEETGPAQHALVELTPKNNPNAVKNWEAQAQNAWLLRRSQPDAMDIYEVKQSEREHPQFYPTVRFLKA